MTHRLLLKGYLKCKISDLFFLQFCHSCPSLYTPARGIEAILSQTQLGGLAGKGKPSRDVLTMVVQNGEGTRFTHG